MGFGWKRVESETLKSRTADLGNVFTAALTLVFEQKWKLYWVHMSLWVHTGVFSQNRLTSEVSLVVVPPSLNDAGTEASTDESAAHSGVSNPSGCLSLSQNAKLQDGMCLVWNRVTLTNTLVCVGILGLLHVLFRYFLCSTGEDFSLTASLVPTSQPVGHMPTEIKTAGVWNQR